MSNTSQSPKKRYALIGTGGRAGLFYTSISRDFAETSVLVAICDTNKTRLDYAKSKIDSLTDGQIPTYLAKDFDVMIQETKPDEVIVTTIDRTHHIYIVRALELGCNVITEKPMTIDVPQCNEIFSAVERTNKRVRVTFNYRYAPHNTKIFELIRSGAIGTVTSIHFEWMLNTSHGADYFRRWHRDARNSGGLLVHKSTHHFDLINFWLQSRPKTVYAQGDLKFYGKKNAEERGVTKFYSRAFGSEAAKDDLFALHLDQNQQLKSLYLDAEHEDGYYRDQSVFGDGISIEDTMNVLLQRNGGRLEAEIVESSYVNSGGEQSLEGAAENITLKLRPLFQEPRDIEVIQAAGGHGGGDNVMLRDLFGESEPDEHMRAASHIDGAASILTGVAANRSIRTGEVVKVSDILTLP
ncbi:Oxidoreductase N-terminal [Penicillium brevicompactum]|uniref:Oxidoreductase N-terminal n=1 Tax=Penicillium brevicompactum TaxID=5074 RepID=A0A9W9RD03_PENBR|nr:Oxidoreductase N-terminal [Penicillium brevicompactum]